MSIFHPGTFDPDTCIFHSRNFHPKFSPGIFTRNFHPEMPRNFHPEFSPWIWDWMTSGSFRDASEFSPRIFHPRNFHRVFYTLGIFTLGIFTQNFHRDFQARRQNPTKSQKNPKTNLDESSDDTLKNRQKLKKSKGKPGGIRASDLQAPWPNCLVVHLLDLPKIPKSKIPKIQNPKIPKTPKIQNPQNPKSKIPKITKISKIPKAKIQNPKSQNLQNPHNPKSKIPKIPKSKIPKIQNPNSPKSKIQTFLAGFWGFWILDFGSLWSNSLREAPNAPNFGFRRRILDFGFWGFWILGIWDFGFWGFWRLDFGELGFWILGPKSQSQNPKSKIPNPNFFGQILGILNFGFWIVM